MNKQTTAQAQLAGKAFSQEGKARAKDAYNEIHDIITDSNNLTQLEKAVEKSIKLMTQFHLDEIARDKLERHAQRRYEHLVMEERRTRREMIANKDRF